MTPLKAKDGRETLQELLRDTAHYYGAGVIANLRCAAADALDAAQAEIARLKLLLAAYKFMDEAPAPLPVAEDVVERAAQALADSRRARYGFETLQLEQMPADDQRMYMRDAQAVLSAAHVSPGRASAQDELVKANKQKCPSCKRPIEGWNCECGMTFDD